MTTPNKPKVVVRGMKAHLSDKSLKERIVTVVGLSRPTILKERTPVEELQDELHPLVKAWIDEKPEKITIPAFLQRFPGFTNSLLLQEALVPILMGYNSAYEGWVSPRHKELDLIIVDEFVPVPHSYTMKFIERVRNPTPESHDVDANADEWNGMTQVD